MRLIVVSDTHRRFAPFDEVVSLHPDVYAYIHLGDGWQELETMRELYPEKKFLGVCGNCDFAAQDEPSGLLEIGGARVFYTHGHLYNVKYTLHPLLQEGKRLRANVVLFGHTHIVYEAYDKKMHVMNPGSLGQPRAGRPSYGIVDITGQGIACHVAYL